MVRKTNPIEKTTFEYLMSKFIANDSVVRYQYLIQVIQMLYANELDQEMFKERVEQLTGPKLLEIFEVVNTIDNKIGNIPNKSETDKSIKEALKELLFRAIRKLVVINVPLWKLFFELLNRTDLRHYRIRGESILQARAGKEKLSFGSRRMYSMERSEEEAPEPM